jgi:CRP-like cAMP-binding protein
MYSRLNEEIKTIADFTDAEIELFNQSFELSEVRKGEYFLKEGQISRHLGYIISGLMMHYKLADGVEIPADFTTENNWVAYLKSFASGTPSDMNIKALEDTQLLLLSGQKMNELFEIQPRFMALRSYYTELSFTRNTEYARSLATLNARDRYYKFMKESPELINRVPQYLIAAYLGIKPQSLSRIRK